MYLEDKKIECCASNHHKSIVYVLVRRKQIAVLREQSPQDHSLVRTCEAKKCSISIAVLHEQSLQKQNDSFLARNGVVAASGIMHTLTESCHKKLAKRNAFNYVTTVFLHLLCTC